ncbi:MAG TPA: exonuclease domain-containing protein, partial [Anaerolineales bacterium]|nr:exonuclease domain-containing protein [Anaerolineales bacterium]
MQTIVAIDIETTGLDPDRDAVIEIGAVKFHGSRIEAEWTSLVNPRRHVPEFITTLTGIDDAMLRGAPYLSDVIPALSEFVGDVAILGHNIRFDLGFLGKAMLLPPTPVIDTYDLAAVLLPGASRYSLGALGMALGVLLPATHRALDDARVTQAVFIRLLEHVHQLPADLIQEIVRLGTQISWGGSFVFEEALGSEKPGRQPSKRSVENLQLQDSAVPPLELPETPVALDPDETAAILEYGGAFARYFPAFEQRPEQVEMLRAVTTALSHGQHLMVEAGTGVGKSFAYLIPAALFAVRNNTRVVVSTNTINLQDQLIRKDIPDLAAALGLQVRATVLKGRANYLCPRRLEIARRFAPRNEVELRVLAKVLVWQLSDSTGDRSNLNLNGNAERDVWLRLSAEDDGCTTETCLSRMGAACPFHRARTAAQSAHILVVNHALLLADVAAQGNVLPQYSYLIVDEGHHLESATTSALSFRTTQPDLDRLMKDIGGSGSGILMRLYGVAKQYLDPGELGRLQQLVSKATDLAFRFDQVQKEFFGSLAEFINRQRDGVPASPYTWQSRVLPQ